MTVIRHPNNQGVTLQQWRKTAAGGETSLSGTDDFSAGLAYTVGAEEVFVNGVLIERGVDYTATSGTSVTLTNALVAGDLATVSSPSAFNVANAIPKATVTAKGDVIVGTAASTVTNLAVGADGTTLVANSANASGLGWNQNFDAGKNKIINGNFNINQRNFTSTTATGTYGFDRWKFGASGGTVTYSAQTFTAGNAPAAGYEGTNYARIVTSGQSAASDYALLQQCIEDVHTLAGNTFTISFWAKAATGTPKVGLELNQTVGTGGSGSSLTSVGNVTISTSWQRYSITGSLASLVGVTPGTNNTSYLEALLWVSAGSSWNSRAGGMQAIQNNTIDFWGVQVEAGSVATAFQTATGTLQGELTACQRYYWGIYSNQAGTTTNYLTFNLGFAASTTAAKFSIRLPVTMRTGPTAVSYSSLLAGDGSGTTYTPSAITVDTSALDIVNLAFTSTSMVAYRPLFLFVNGSTSAYLAFSAEL